MTKPKNSSCDKTLMLTKNQVVVKLKNSNCERKNQTVTKTQYVIKLKKSNYDKTEKLKL